MLYGRSGTTPHLLASRRLGDAVPYEAEAGALRT